MFFFFEGGGLGAFGFGVMVLGGFVLLILGGCGFCFLRFAY